MKFIPPPVDDFTHDIHSDILQRLEITHLMSDLIARVEEISNPAVSTVNSTLHDNDSNMLL